MKLLSYYLADHLLEHIFGIDAYQYPLVIGVALSVNSDPTPSGDGLVEPSEDDGYSREATYASYWTYGTIDGVVAIYNNIAFVFDEASGDWGTITHFALFDSANYDAGKMLFYCPLTPSRVVAKGCIPRFDAETLVITMD